MRATGANIPPELFDNILSFTVRGGCDAGPGQIRDMEGISLVCVHWGKRYRQKVWAHRAIRITTLEKAKWFKWLLDAPCSARLGRPVVDFIQRVEVVIDHLVDRSWLHLLYSPKTQMKLDSLHFDSLRSDPEEF